MKRFLKPAKLPVMCQNKAIFTSLRVSVMWHLAFGGRPYDIICKGTNMGSLEMLVNRQAISCIRIECYVCGFTW